MLDEKFKLFYIIKSVNDVSIFQDRLKELEQEDNFVAGEQFLIMSNNQLREVRLNFIFFIYFETVSHSVAQTCLELPMYMLTPTRDSPPISPSQVLRLQPWTTIPGW